jgi:hypothetical protein
MPGLLRGVARTAAVAGTATAVSNRVSRRQGARWAEQEPAASQEPYAAPPAPDAGGDDRIAKLEQLGSLRDQGVLTAAEFEAEKARVLGR